MYHILVSYRNRKRIRIQARGEIIMTIYGYGRVSTSTQNLGGQIEELKRLGATEIYSEKISGASKERPELEKLIEILKEGDTLIVTRMDRVARSLTHGIDLIEQLNDKGVKFVVGNMGTFDNSTNNKLVRNILLAVAEWEREITLERQLEGIEEAKKQGKYKGRQTTYTSDNNDIIRALDLFMDRATNKLTVDEIAKMTGIGRATIYRKYKEFTEKGII